MLNQIGFGKSFGLVGSNPTSTSLSAIKSCCCFDIDMAVSVAVVVVAENKDDEEEEWFSICCCCSWEPLMHDGYLEFFIAQLLEVKR